MARLVSTRMASPFITTWVVLLSPNTPYCRRFRWQSKQRRGAGRSLPAGMRSDYWYGAVMKTAKVEEGATVAIFGLGGIGLSAIIGATMAKAHVVFRRKPVLTD